MLVTYNQPDLVYACLVSLAECDEVPYQLIVVDNGSGPATRSLLDRIAGARIIRNAGNLGYVRASNQGAHEAGAPSLLLLNSDVVLLRPALAAAAATLHRDSRVGVVGARIILPNGRLQEAGGCVLGNGGTRGRGRNADPADAPYRERRDVDYVSGAFLLTRRDLWRKLGGFDEAYTPGYYEDVDYCARARDLGASIVYEPGATVLHYEHGSGSKRQALALMRRNRDRFLMRRHAAGRTGWRPPPITGPGRA